MTETIACVIKQNWQFIIRRILQQLDRDNAKLRTSW